MGAPAPEYLMRSLGSLPSERKARFVSEALRILGDLPSGRPVQRPRPPREDRAALARLSKQAGRLIQAIKQVGESETASMLLKDAWLNLEHEAGEALSNPVPVLERLQKAAELCIPQPRKVADRASSAEASISSNSSMAVIALAHQFQECFERRPAFGAGSSFVRFVREALPAYGLTVPSLAEMKRLTR